MNKSRTARLALTLCAITACVGAFASLSCLSGGKAGKFITAEAPALAEGSLRVHYQRDDGKYSGYGLWIWQDVAQPSSDRPGGWPTAASPFSGVDSFGAWVDLPLKPDAKVVGFVVLKIAEGDAGKDGADKNHALADKYREIFIKQGDDAVYVSADFQLPAALLKAEMVSAERISLGFTSDVEVKALEISVKDKDGKSVAVVGIEQEGSDAEISGAFDLAKGPYEVSWQGRSVVAKEGLKLFDAKYSYEGGDLGCLFSKGRASFKLWAPSASVVTAVFYDKADQDKEIGRKSLSRADKGVWSLAIGPADIGISDLRGIYYQYEVTTGAKTNTVLDPYAKSMAAFSESGKDKVGKAAILDPAAIGPALSFAKIPGYGKREDAIIWEAHVRDLTSDPSIEAELKGARWGSYKAVIAVLPYVKSLGVTHIQLLPIMAYYYGDELKAGTRELNWSAGGNIYNWGFDPHNYFSLDGAYSENAADPELRVKEFKELVKAIHDAGMGVVLDVVYTHMAQAKFLNDIEPNYYFFRDASGKFVGGFGNNLATNHFMARKLMVDSVRYWFSEYKIDGMRFDMMGDATDDSVQEAYDAAAAINPNALFIGEGWRTFAGKVEDSSLRGATQDWMTRTDSVAVFADAMRNELKSGFGSEGQKRFLTGGARSVGNLFKELKGQPTNFVADDPGDAVQYIEAHDNMTLHDVIAYCIRKKAADAQDEIFRRMKIGNALVLSSQGIAFLHAGQEYGRSKQWFGTALPSQKFTKVAETGDIFIHDSYDSSDAVNMISWEKIRTEGRHKANVEYTKGLIALRKSSDAFRLGSKDLVNKNMKQLAVPEISGSDLCIAYSLEATDGQIFYVLANVDEKGRDFSLEQDISGAQVLVDDDEAGILPVKKLSGIKMEGKKISLDPLTVVILKKEAGK